MDIDDLFLFSSDLYEKKYILQDELCVINGDITQLKNMCNVLNCYVANYLIQSRNNLMNKINDINIQIIGVEMEISIKCKNYVDLDISFMGLKHVDSLKVLTNLKSLDISGNCIFNVRSLINLIHLTQLNISRNCIHSIDCFKNLIQLQWLNIEENFISDISYITTLTNLRFLNIIGNDILNFIPLQSFQNVLIYI